MDPRNQRQTLPPLPSIILFMMMRQQLLEYQANTIPWRGSYYDLPVCVGPVYQGMPQQHQHQYRAPSSGPNRNQRSKGFRKAETHNLNKIVHESSGIIAGDYSTGIYPGNARIGVNDNTGACKMRTKPYNRDRSSRPQKKVRTDKVNTSAYEIPIMRTKRGARASVPKIPTPGPAMPPTWSTARTPSTLAPAASTSTACTETTRTRKTKAQKKQPVEKDDFDTISLGSDTD